MTDLDALLPDGNYRSRTRTVVADVTGAEVARLSSVPTLLVSRTIDTLRAADPLDLDKRLAALRHAGELFAGGSVDGMLAEDYFRLAARIGGLPIAVIREGAAVAVLRLAQIGKSLDSARPHGAVTDWRDPRVHEGSAVWTRRGEVFSVHASGTHPGAHSLWPEALAMGYRVAVRPTRREPLTAYRMVAALRAAGFGPDQVVLLPTTQAAGDTMLTSADLAYGGDDIIRKYVDDPMVLQQQPGRSKILITEDVDWRDYIDVIVSSVADHAGGGCVNTTGVLVEGDPAPVAEAVAERLAMLPSLPPEHPDAVLPVQQLVSAQALDRFLLSQAHGTRAWLGGEGILHDLGDGSAVLRPAVHQVDRSDARQLGVEMPFPCVWVGPWSRADGIAPLADTLVLTVATEDERLVNQLITAPGIGNVYLGQHPTYWTKPGLPHDGYLADFLMRTKSVIRDR
ncbi:aldehyde dehydrogenase family protein [Pseudonocardiaceae bacterium YIM PH 21723]|nr:aldehyde dehydrogenase family protein [Pseudonocardiaceae bacterium YIM PH 21723]